MHDFTEPDPPARERKSSGCTLGCLGILLVPVLLVLIAYLVLFHTSVPLKRVAKLFEGNITANGKPAEFRGVGGSLASGITLKELILPGDAGNSTISGLTFRYNGLLDAIRNKRLVIEEFSIEQSDFVVGADFFEGSTEEDDSDDDDAPTSDTASKGEGLALFELRELRLENTRFRSAEGELDLKIPLIHLAGLKIAGDDFELAELEVTSDYLNIELADAKPEQVEGHLLPFSRKVQGQVLPDFHPMVIAAFDFSVELAAVEGKTKSRVIAFGGAYRQTLLPQGSLVQIDGLTVADYFDTQGYVMPERFSMEAREVEKVVTIGSGEFFLGATRFEIAKQHVDADDPKSAILGTAEISGHAVKARIRPDKSRIWPPFVVELTSEPEMTQPELLAQIYFQRAYSALDPDEKARIDGFGSSE